jgi:hypothetical protein
MVFLTKMFCNRIFHFLGSYFWKIQWHSLITLITSLSDILYNEKSIFMSDKLMINLEFLYIYTVYIHCRKNIKFFCMSFRNRLKRELSILFHSEFK